MQASTIEESETTAEEPSRAANIKRLFSTTVGAIVAVALLLALGVWFYRLGVRDAQNVPIIRAALDPVKVRPEDPGGTETPHQDITSYQVAETEPVQAAATVVAPAPPEPRPEDIAMGDLAAASVPNPPDARPSSPVGDTSSSPAPSIPTDDATDVLQNEIDRQVAAVLSETPSDTGVQPPSAAPETTVPDDTRIAAATPTPSQPEEPAQSEAPQPDLSQTEPEQDAPAVEEPEAEPLGAGTEYAPAASPTVPRRPSNLLARVEEAKKQEAQSVTDLASRAASSPVQVQLAADPDETAIRQQWRRIYNANSDVLRDRALAIQQTVSGGTTFYRLRVGPFETTSEARAVCQALKARGQDCIVARNG